MSLSNIKKLQSERGFTIVELLIVIVVIGILAAIVIVAYTGVTRNANNNKIKSNASSIQKVAETINANSGSYPSDAVAANWTNSENGNTVKLPEGITLASVTAAPTNTQTAVDNAKNGTFSVWVCAGGANIYYPVDGVTTGAQQVIKAGAGC